MNNRLFPRMCLVIPLITSFLFMPVNRVNAAGYSSDADYWRWWYIEHQTDAITDGQGASAENIENTDSGQTAGTVIYNQSEVTRGDFIDYVEEQYNQAEGYLQKGVDYYVDAVNHVYDSTVTAGTKAAYQTQKAVREVVDASGNVIVDVSGSDFWHSAYNNLFNGNGYKDQYAEGENTNSYNVPTDIGNVTIDVDIYDKKIAGNPVESNIFIGGCELTNATYNNLICKATYNGESVYYGFTGDNRDILYIISTNVTIVNDHRLAVGCGFNDGWNTYTTIYIDIKESISGNVTNNTEPTLLPSQMGFIIDPLTGDRTPVYTDPTQNPFTINPDGTVDYNGNKYPIYVDPDEISPDGWLKILEFIDNEDETESPYNPQGQPWNTQNDGSVLGGFFSNLITDIGNLFSGLTDKLKDIVDKIANFFTNFIDSIVDAIKKFIEIFIGDLDLDAMTDLDITNPFGMIQDCYDLLLELLGVNTT